ncbi:MAG: glycosyltransferase family 4 protein [Kiritimatiellales bacterium]
MKTAIVHYHARPGGVTRVVERAVDSLGNRTHCLFFTGEAARAETPLQKKIRVVPNLGYSTDEKFQPLELLKRARGAFGGEPDLWHIHNHSLGKNPALTQEVITLAMSGKKILLQIHDFAEDGRPDNYRNLNKLKNRLYPVAPHIHYAVLNNRDFNFLKTAGIPEETLHLLPNAVSPVPAIQSLKPKAQSLFVYPCRAIRRKNIGELLLWSALMPDAKFAVTLAPKNPDVKPIYDAWVAFAKELELNVEFNAGAKTSFEEMVAQADALITTSIAEGFGLAFLEPWLAGKPLTGRNLPEITGDFAAHGLDLSALYSRLPIPLVSNHWKIDNEFFQTLENKLRAAYEAYGREWNDVIFEEAKAALVQGGCVDFGILDEEMQRTIIRAVKNDPSLIDLKLGDSSASVASNQTVTETAYGSKAYGDQLFGIYEQLLKTKAGSVTYADSEKLLDKFLQPQRFNLLRT